MGIRTDGICRGQSLVFARFEGEPSLLREAKLNNKPAALAQAISSIWQARDDRYSEIRTAATARERKIEMSYIGG